MKSDSKSLETKIQELRQSTNEHILELKNTLNQLSKQQTQYISFFTYSFNIAHHLQMDNICIASYHIKNTGDYPITNPEITLELSDECPFSFHGKYLNSGSQMPSKLKDGWVRINDTVNLKEYRLKPIGDTVILPGETLTFSSFQLIWSPSKDYSGSLTGWTFSDQITEGIAALNAINISGTLSIGEDYIE